MTPPKHDISDFLHRSWLYTKNHLNFYRIHVLFFTFTPLITAAIFYASNGATHVAFIDALFLCVSHMTVTGLTTVDLSSLTPWQQVILFLLMCMGSPVTVSWLIVYIRRRFFAKKFEHVILSHSSSRPSPSQALSHSSRSHKLDLRWLSKSKSSGTPEGEKGSAKRAKVTADMIQRVEGAPRLVDPSGWVDASDQHASKGKKNIASTIQPAGDELHATQQGGMVQSPLGTLDSGARMTLDDNLATRSPFHQGTHSHPYLPAIPSAETVAMDREHPTTAHSTSNSDGERHFTRSQTVEFVAPDLEQTRIHGRRPSHGGADFDVRKISRGSIMEASLSATRPTHGSIHEMDTASAAHDHLYPENRVLPGRTATMQSNRSSRLAPLRVKEEDFGGFPLPHVIFSRILRRFFPRLQQRLTRTVTIPHTTTIQSQRGGQTTVLGAKPVSYISFDAIVGRNSAFHGLTRENLQELGGVEYRALNALLCIVGMYHIFVPLVGFVIIAPYISLPRWRDAFYPPMQHRFIAPVWYSLFQVISAYTNTGSSLVDQSMVPFQKAYPEVLTLPFLILAGNTAFPIFLRFVIWFLSKLVKKTSRAHETLHFLLDHPRRCFIYLFPSHQTWFLLTVLILLNFTDWFFFIILDIGNPQISIPLGTRFAVGLLQAIAVRAAGFGAVALSALAPAVKVLYVVMMYISVYPIAMSVRTTNVYEERSLGVFDDDMSANAEEVALGERSRAKVWGKYLAAHARQQLSFDMWWLALALFLLCIVERAGLEDENNATWFNIFAIVFELTSAYGTVGLSLGTANASYSLSGVFKPLSKLIMCAVMLRGRHRGLPVAIDRAVLLPAEFKKESALTDAELCGGAVKEQSFSLGEKTSDETPKNESAPTEKDDKGAEVEEEMDVQAES